MKSKIHIVKIGGSIIDDSIALHKFLANFAAIEGTKILVHGGGKLTDKLAAELGLRQQMIEGRRVTDVRTLELAVMTYAGLISKTITANLQALGCNAIGLCGADLNLIAATKRLKQDIDYGFVGDVSDTGVNTHTLTKLLAIGVVPVFSAITHDTKGQLLNTNADTIASVLAIALSELFEVKLMYCFEKNGVLFNSNDEDSVIAEISSCDFTRLKQQGLVSKGMLPKMENAFNAISKGTAEVIICNADSVLQKEASKPFTRLLK